MSITFHKKRGVWKECITFLEDDDILALNNALSSHGIAFEIDPWADSKIIDHNVFQVLSLPKSAISDEIREAFEKMRPYEAIYVRGE